MLLGDAFAALASASDQAVPMPVGVAWGKQRGLPPDAAYPVVLHLADAAGAAAVLWDTYLSTQQRRVIGRGLGFGDDTDPGPARGVACLWAGLHDIGKTAPAFQAGQPELWRALVAACGQPAAPVAAGANAHTGGHAWDGHALLAHHLAARGYVTDDTAAFVTSPAQRAAQVIGGHHGGYRPALDRNTAASTVHALWAGHSAWQSLPGEVIDVVTAACGHPRAPERVDVDAAVLLTGLIVLADWVVSRVEFIAARQAETGAAARLAPGVTGAAAAATLDADAVTAHLRRAETAVRAELPALGLCRPAATVKPFSAAFGGWRPRDLQADLEQRLPDLVTGPGLLLVMAATGEGKTEAALQAASLLAAQSGAGGFFFALPTMATADAMLDRAVDYLDQTAAQSVAISLLHSMADLNTAYQQLRARDPRAAAAVDDPAGPVQTEHRGDREDPGESAHATDWLRGSRRGALAPVSVGTIDQVLAAVLRGHHQPLRWLGLAGRVLVVDEAHAYDAYMQALLRRALEWLGRLGVPVVMLSATLPTHTTQSLLAAYRRGAHPDRAPLPAPQVPYPGWIHYDTGRDHLEAAEAAPAAPRTAEVHLRAWRSAPGDGRGTPAHRDRALLEALDPILAGPRGCAAVVCNTVADAQATYQTLRAVVDARGIDVPVLLLHARFPLWRRAEITDQVRGWFGKDARRPARAIVVATQVIEQSLDLDFDLLVSDLAPMALLIQRLGRVWRHDRDRAVRPDAMPGPRLVVLAPTGDGSTTGPLNPPRFPYEPALLERTWTNLVRHGDTVDVPGHVQGLVDGVYATDWAELSEEQLADALRAIAQEEAAANVAGLGAVPPLVHVVDLADLTSPLDPDEALGTRLDAAGRRILPVYADPRGALYFDQGLTRPVPAAPSGRGRFTPEQVRSVVKHTVPVREARWLTDVLAADAALRPPSWSDVGLLAHTALLQLPRDGTARAACTRRVRLDHDLGLLIDPTGTLP